MTNPEKLADDLTSEIRKIGNAVHETVKPGLIDILASDTLADTLSDQKKEIEDSPDDIAIRFKMIVARLDAGRHTK